MSLPQEPRPEDDELERYVLGLLSPPRRERIDEDSIVDDDVAARLRTVEDDLISGYLRGTLDKDRRDRFESYFMSSVLRRRNVEFSAALLRAVDRTAAKQVDGDAPRAAAGYPADELITVRPRFRLDLAAIAALVLAACAALLLLAIRDNAPREADTRGVAADAPAAKTPAGETARSQEPAPAETPLPEAPAKPARRRPESELPTIALVLVPQTRSLAPVPALAIQPGAERAQFELQLESNDFVRYQVALRDPATNQIMWRSAWNTPNADRVSVSVPANLLKPQHYSLDLSGRDEAGAEVIGSYAFRIVPR
jgi:hypothetical protein